MITEITFIILLQDCFNKDLNLYSRETVKMFYEDALKSRFNI